MPFYLGALRMLNIATGYSKNTLSCSEWNEEHAGECFRSPRHILTPVWACKAKKCHFSRKFDLWPDLTRSNIDLGPKTICAIARSRRGASTGLFREALRPSGADRQGGGSYQPPPPDRPRYEKCPDRARVKGNISQGTSVFTPRVQFDPPRSNHWPNTLALSGVQYTRYYYVLRKVWRDSTDKRRIRIWTVVLFSAGQFVRDLRSNGDL